MKLKTYGPKRLGWARFVPYPLRATKLSFDLNIFGFWLVPEFYHKKDLTEQAKADGAPIWWFRWLWFQISYGRWV